MNKNLIATILVVISLIFLIPGVLLPMLHMGIKCNIQTGLGEFNLDVMDKSYSIFETVKDLWRRDKAFVGSLIFLFSVLVPVGKSIIFLLMIKTKTKKFQLYRLLSGWSKWSMADVFVIAILLTYLASGNEAQSQVNELSVFGMKLKFKINLLLSSELLSGFYYFLSYCLISILAMAIYENPLLPLLKQNQACDDKC